MKKDRFFTCIKGMADGENINILVMQGDIVKFLERDDDDGSIYVEVIDGWMQGMELCFSPKDFVKHFVKSHPAILFSLNV